MDSDFDREIPEEEPEVLEAPDASDAPEAEYEPAPEPEQERDPALVITVQSWTLPLVALLALVIGLVGGYLLQPQINSALQGLRAGSVEVQAPVTEVAVQPSGVTQAPVEQAPGAQEPAVAATESPEDAAARQEVMDYLIGMTRHFKGDPDASVVLLEFSDFQ